MLKLRSSLRSIKYNCVNCRMFRAATIQPIMADLPVERLAYQSPPIKNTGVDYFGRFYVTVCRTTEKRWGFLFTCLTTRAVHFEIVPFMKASSCVKGVDRFFSRWGTSANIWSSMALTLLARKKNARISKIGTPSSSPSNLPTKALSGDSIRPARHTKVASASGGGWYVILREYFTPSSVLVASHDKVLNTSSCLIEYALNSCPLTPVSADLSDLGAITPNYFLIGNQTTAIPSIVGVDEFDHCKRYARAQSYANTIWSTWIKEYILALNRNSKWQTAAEQQLKTGDLVWVVEETNPRCYYPTAWITELHYCSDSVAHSAVLCTSTGSLLRPLVKLIPILPTSSSGPEDVTE